MFHHRFLLLLLVAQVASFTVNPCGRLQGYGVAVSGLQKQRLYSDVSAADVSDTDVSNSSDLLEKPEDTPDSAEVSDSVDLSGSVEKNAEESESVVSEAEASPASAEKKFTAFVGNLPYTSSVMEIRELFGQYGEVVYVNLPRDKVSGRAKGFAFVDMASKDDLDKAIEALNGMEMGGRAIRVAASVPKEELPEAPKRNVPKDGEKLYVGNLPFEATESDIRDFFSEYGTVQGIYMPKSDDGTPRGYAFVTMSKDSYEKTLEATHEAEFMGRLLKVNTPLPPGERSKARGDSVRSSSRRMKLYIGNLSFYTAPDTVIALFEEFGKVYDCYLPEDSVTGSSRGFGFVTMDRDAAMVAIEETDGCELDGRIIRVNEAQSRARLQTDDEE